MQTGFQKRLRRLDSKNLVRLSNEDISKSDAGSGNRGVGNSRDIRSLERKGRRTAIACGRARKTYKLKQVSFLNKATGFADRKFVKNIRKVRNEPVILRGRPSESN